MVINDKEIAISLEFGQRLYIMLNGYHVFTQALYYEKDATQGQF